MWVVFKKLPLAISIPVIFIIMMMIPSLHGFHVGNENQGRTFLYAALIGSFSLGFISILVQNEPLFMYRHPQLLSCLCFFLVLPFFLAIPFHEAIASQNIINAYLDLVSVVTTTGLPVFSANALSETIIIWRVCVGWTSGFLMWVFAWSLFAQLNLSGLNHLGGGDPGIGYGIKGPFGKAGLPVEKFWREAARLGPIYFLITTVTALSLLFVSGDPIFAVLRAMSTIATFGVDLPGHPGSGWSSEAILILVMFFALSRGTFSRSSSKTKKWLLLYDPEIRVAAILIALAIIILVSLSWSKNSHIGSLVETIWGVFFTSVSFLTTTGLTSTHIPEVLRGFDGAGIIFVALAMLGGGVATTAGGIKLLRVYILAKHCKAEVDHLIAPSQVKKRESNFISMNYPNAMLACVFLILFILVFAAISLGLTLTGSNARESLYLTLATMTNTGPLATGFGDSESIVIELGTSAKLILVFAMVFGRLEVLALLALLNPDIYR
jgi:trk system potassium uptake protein TrkH